MPKPKSTGKRRVWLGRTVKRALRVYGGLETEHTATRAAVSDYLLEKLLSKDPNFSSEKLAKAKRLAGHSARISEAISSAQTKQQIAAKNARRILQIALNQMPEYMKRNKEKLSEKDAANFNDIQKKLTDKLIKVADLPDKQQVELSLPFLKIANRIHLDTMRSLLGEKKFRAYARAMEKTMKTEMERKKKPNTQKG